MRITRLTYLVLLIAISSFYSCKKKINDPIVFISPSDLYQYGNPGDVKLWNVTVTGDAKIVRFMIQTVIENSFVTTFLDTSLSLKEFNYTMQYEIPNAAAGKSVSITFRAFDEEGNEGTNVKGIFVGDKLLTEQSGLEFFTLGRGTNNGFNLETVSQVTVGVDSAIIDLQENTVDTLENPVYKWKSPAAGQSAFVKANNYDYANATEITSKQVFDASTKQAVTDSLISGDIYITKLGGVTPSKYMVIKIVSIIDEAPGGPAFDRYVFNIKK